jgi:AraC-like DNA-binding protein
MVKNGQSSDVPRLTYRAGHDSIGAVEVITFARLRTMPAGNGAGTVQRADFHVLAVVDSGRGRATVDFVDYHLERGVIVWIRPGRVHCWDDISAVEGTLVLFRPEAVPSESPGADPHGPVSWRPGASWSLVRLAADHLRREHDDARAEPLPGSISMLRALLGVLLLRASEGAPRPSDARVAFIAFAKAVEVNFAASREVAWYARRLGYSERTLRRATQEAVGRTAKQFVDDRVVLEAKRLLVHSNVTVAECARRTGFDDPTNFSKFFRSRAGLSPGAFAGQGGAAQVCAPPPSAIDVATGVPISTVLLTVHKRS